MIRISSCSFSAIEVEFLQLARSIRSLVGNIHSNGPLYCEYFEIGYEEAPAHVIEEVFGKISTHNSPFGIPFVINEHVVTGDFGEYIYLFSLQSFSRRLEGGFPKIYEQFNRLKDVEAVIESPENDNITTFLVAGLLKGIEDCMLRDRILNISW